jgi:hypothetical protein
LLHFESLRFALASTLLGTHRPGADKSRRSIQPAAEDNSASQRFRLAPLQNEHRLGDILSKMRVTGGQMFIFASGDFPTNIRSHAMSITILRMWAP